MILNVSGKDSTTPTLQVAIFNPNNVDTVTFDNKQEWGVTVFEHLEMLPAGVLYFGNQDEITLYNADTLPIVEPNDYWRPLSYERKDTGQSVWLNHLSNLCNVLQPFIPRDLYVIGRYTFFQDGVKISDTLDSGSWSIPNVPFTRTEPFVTEISHFAEHYYEDDGAYTIEYLGAFCSSHTHLYKWSKTDYATDALCLARTAGEELLIRAYLETEFGNADGLTVEYVGHYAALTRNIVREIPSIPITLVSEVTNGPYNPPNGGQGGGGIPSTSGGGDGSFPSDPGPSLVERIPDGQSGNDIAQSGLFTMYLMNQQYMNLMGEILWEDNVAIQAIKKIFGNPIDSVISTISYPFNLLNLVSYGAKNLYIGPWDTGLPFRALTKSSFQIDWGTISIPFAWGNFLDYSPHTKMELFLPWGPGYVTIDPNDVSPFSNTPGNFNVSTFTSGSIQVKTNIELGKGTCVHNVIGNNGRVIGSYSGIVGKQVPITALDTGGKALTTISAVSSIVGGVVAGSLAAKGAMDSGRLTGAPMKDPMRPFESASYWDTGMISGRASAQNLINTGHNLASRATNSTPITFPRAGTFSDGSSAMTVQTPFLIISRPVQSVPMQYGHYNGYPSNIYYSNFFNIFGYTEISEIHLDNVTATADELQELDAILKGGILL